MRYDYRNMKKLKIVFLEGGGKSRNIVMICRENEEKFVLPPESHGAREQNKKSNNPKAL